MDTSGWKVVASRGEPLLGRLHLIQTGDDRGRVLYAEGFGPEMALDAFLKFGYWEPNEDQTPLRNALANKAPIVAGPEE